MKNKAKNKDESVFKTNICKSSLYPPLTMRLRLVMIVLIILIDGPNLSTFLVIAVAPIIASALFFLTVI